MKYEIETNLTLAKQRLLLQLSEVLLNKKY